MGSPILGQRRQKDPKPPDEGLTAETMVSSPSFLFLLLFFFSRLSIRTGLLCCGLTGRVLASVATIHLAIHASQFHAIKPILKDA